MTQKAFGLVVGDRARERPACLPASPAACAPVPRPAGRWRSSERSVQDKRARSCQTSSGPSSSRSLTPPQKRQAGRPAGERACKGCTHARHFCSFSSMLACTRTTHNRHCCAAARPPSPPSLSYRHYTCSHRAYLHTLTHTHTVATGHWLAS